ncbi:MAG: response regulator [Bradymonadia bacterium]
MLESGLALDGDRAARVLVIDDEPHICHLLDRILSMHRFQVTTCSHNPQDIDAFERELTGYDAILCDMSMVGVDAPSLYESLSQAAPQLARRLVVMTGGILNSRYADFVTESQPHLVEKPFELEHLFEVIKRAIQEGRSGSTS